MAAPACRVELQVWPLWPGATGVTAAALAGPPALAEGGEPCNQRHCGAGQFCCNFSCSICAPEGGFCTQQICS
jgi:hypothetical protein